MLKRKKGIALNQAFGAVLTLVLVAVLVIVGIILFANLNTAIATTSTVNVVAENLTTVTETGEFVTGSNNCSFGGFAVASAFNATSGTTIPTTNFTTTAAGLVSFTAGVSEGFNNSDWTLNYTYTWGSAACEAGESMIVQFATYPALIGLVGTIIFLGIIIGVLVSSFVFGGKQGV